VNYTSLILFQLVWSALLSTLLPGTIINLYLLRVEAATMSFRPLNLFAWTV